MAKQHAQAPAAAASARPGTKDEKGKKEKKVRAQYAIPEGGLTAWPADFDSKLNKPLKRKDFADESLFLLSKADEYDRRAKALRQEAEESKKLGSIKDRAKAKQLLKMQKRMKEMTDAMAAEGIDVAALLATVNTNGDAAAKETAAAT